MIEVTATDVREVLGPYGKGWSDAQIESDATMIPARQALLELCPDADEITDLNGMMTAEIALSSIVAANLIMASPRYQASRLGDSSVTFTTNSETERANRLMAQARELMADVCPEAAKPRLIRLYRQASGGRGLNR